MSSISLKFMVATVSQMLSELRSGAEMASSIAYSAFVLDWGFVSGANLVFNSVKTISKSKVLSADVNSCNTDAHADRLS